MPLSRLTRKTRNVRFTDEAPRLDMSSLIDVSFLLLIYFLVTSTLDPKEADLGLTLPATRGPSIEVTIDTMRIEVDASGHVIVNQEVLEDDSGSRHLPTLEARLRTYRESAEILDCETLVVVAANDAANAQRLIDVLNSLAAPGIEISNVTLEDFSSP